MAHGKGTDGDSHPGKQARSCTSTSTSKTRDLAEKMERAWTRWGGCGLDKEGVDLESKQNQADLTPGCVTSWQDCLSFFLCKEVCWNLSDKNQAWWHGAIVSAFGEQDVEVQGEPRVHSQTL